MRLNPNSPRRLARCRGVALAALVIVVTVPTAAAAAVPAYADPMVIELAQAGAAETRAVLNRIRNWIMAILGTLAVVFFTIGAVRYLLAAGDPGEVDKAKTAFKSAGLGFGLASLAPIVVMILEGIVA